MTSVHLTIMELETGLENTVQTLLMLPMIRPAIDRAGIMLAQALERGNKILMCGNGGSAAEAAHFATELVGRYAKSRRSLPAIALSSDGSLLSCIGNDYGYDNVFARQVAGLARPGDLLVVFTSSGNSTNIVEAIREAQRCGIESIAFLGRGGGKSKGLATCDLIVPGESAPATQEAHLFLIHHFCRIIDNQFD